MALNLGTPPENAVTTRGRQGRKFPDEARALIELAFDGDERAANLGAFLPKEPTGDAKKDASVARTFTGAVNKGSRKADFYGGEGVWEAKFDPKTYEVWVRCIDPAMAQEAIDSLTPSEKDEDANELIDA